MEFIHLSLQVQITVLDENDNSPQFDPTSESVANVAEDCPTGRRIALVMARDPDAGNNGVVNRFMMFWILFWGH